MLNCMEINIDNDEIVTDIQKEGIWKFLNLPKIKPQ